MIGNGYQCGDVEVTVDGDVLADVTASSMSAEYHGPKNHDALAEYIDDATRERAARLGFDLDRARGTYTTGEFELRCDPDTQKRWRRFVAELLASDRRKLRNKRKAERRRWRDQRRKR